MMIRLSVWPGAWRVFCAGFALLLLAACSGGGPVLPDLPITQSEYRLGNGDQVQVTVYSQPELTGEHVVDGAGNISMPLIGTVSAGGGTARHCESGRTLVTRPARQWATGSG